MKLYQQPITDGLLHAGVHAHWTRNCLPVTFEMLLAAKQNLAAERVSGYHRGEQLRLEEV